MRLSVVIPVLDGRDVLARCLAGVAAQTRNADEVIVVDDGSADDSASVAAAHGATLIADSGGPRGPAWARNRGVAAATGDVVVFVDADVVLHADVLARMAATLEAHPEVHALFGSYDTNPTAPGVASRFKNLLHHYVHQHGKRQARSFWAGCGAVRREVFLAVGGFDERFRQPSVEDIELGLRLVRVGFSIWLCPDIQGTHLKRWTLSSLWRTDIFARAVPWTRLVLREAHVPDDLNLGWRSRTSAVACCVGMGLLFGAVALVGLAHANGAWGALGGAAVCFGASTSLNWDLHRFFFRHGTARFAVGAWALHQAYLLYSSAVFGVLFLAHRVTKQGLS